VQQDTFVIYDIQSFTSDEFVPTWNPIEDGPYDTWFSRERVIVGLSSVTQDQASTYDIYLSVYGTSANAEWDILSDVGTIVVIAPLPYGSVQADSTSVYQVFYVNSPTKDITASYRIINEADNISTALYDVTGSVQQDYVALYGLGGTVQEDMLGEYSIYQTANADISASYRLLNAAQKDYTAEYLISTSPLTAGDNRTVIYNVVGSANSYSTIWYNVLTSVEADKSASYTIQLGAENDVAALFNIRQGVETSRTVTYQVAGRITASQDIGANYQILGVSSQVPNLIGYTITRAKKVLEQRGFQLGQVIYN
jgi:hypothetical protein